MKRLFAILLAVLMIVSVFPVSSLAEGGEPSIIPGTEDENPEENYGAGQSVATEIRLKWITNDVYSLSTAGIIDTNFTVPEGKQLQVVDSGSLTVQAGKTMTVNGNLYITDNAQLQVSGSLVVNGSLQILGHANATVSGSITVNDTYVGVGGESSLTVSGSLRMAGGSITTVAGGTFKATGSLSLEESVISVTYSSEAYISAAMSSTDSYIMVTDSGYCKLSGTSTINGGSIGAEDSGFLEISGQPTLNGSYLYAYGSGIVNVRSAVTFGYYENDWGVSNTHVYADGGNVTFNNSINGEVNFTQNGSGKINGVPKSEINQNYVITSDSDLRAAVRTAAEGNYMYVSADIYGSVTLNAANGDLNTSDMSIYIGETGSLTIPEGMKVTAGNIACFSALNVEGTLIVPEGGDVYIYESGMLNLDGSVENNGIVYVSGNVSYGGSYSGEGTFSVARICTTEAELHSFIDSRSGSEPWELMLYVDGTIVLSSDLTIPAGAILVCFYDNSKLSVPKGITLTNNGFLDVEAPGKLAMYGTLVNNGIFYGETGAVDITGTVTGDGFVTVLSYIHDAADMEEALHSNATDYDIVADVTLSKSITIPETVTVYIEEDAALTMNSGTTLTNNGTIIVGGVLNIKGNYVSAGREKIWLVENGAVYPETIPHVNENSEPTSIRVSGPDRVSANSTAEYTVTVEPEDCVYGGVIFSVISGSDLAEIDVESGILTAGDNSGVVTIRVQSVDYADVSFEFEVEIIKAAVVISGESKLLSGNTTVLTAEFLPENYTGASVVWRIREGDEKFASLDSKGKLKAAAVSERHAVTVYAAASDNSVSEGSWNVNIIPAPEAVAVYCAEPYYAEVTGQTLTVDINAYPTLSLSAMVMPYELADEQQNGAEQSVTWSSSSASVAEVDSEGRVYFYRTGTVTVTAKSAVNGRSAGVKLTAVKDITDIIAVPQNGVYTEDTPLDSAAALIGGKSRTVSVILDGEPTRSGVQWSIVGGGAAFASVKAGSAKKNADGQVIASASVTAAAVTAPEQICLRVESQTDSEKFTELYMWVIPQACSVSILGDEGDITGKTVMLDMNSGMPLDLYAMVQPDDAFSEAVWSVGKNTVEDSFTDKFAEYRVSGNSLMVYPQGQTGSVTLNATATDGSKKSAKVTVKFVRYARSVTITDAPDTILGGKSISLKTDIAAQTDLTDRKVTWTLSEDSLAYASISSSGKLTARSAAREVTVSVTATAAGGASDTIEITIEPNIEKSLDIEMNGCTVNGRTLTVDLSRGAVTLSAVTEGLENTDITWKSSSDKIAIVVDGDVQLFKTGTVTITATGSDGKTKATVKLKIVAGVADVSVGVKEGTAELTGGKTLQLTATVSSTVEGVKPTSSSVVWKVVSGADIVTVSSSGRLKAKNVTSRCVVTVAAVSKEDAMIGDSIDIVVTPAATGVAIELPLGMINSKSGVSINIGELTGLQLSAEVYPYAASQNITWKSSSTAVATVADGYVTFHKAGSVTITATAENGKKASVTFKVVRLMGNGELSVSIDGKTAASECTVLSGKTLTLKTLVSEPSVTNKKVTWSIVDGSSYAKISSSGKLTAKTVSADKTVIVRASAADGSGEYADITVTVKAELS